MSSGEIDRFDKPKQPVKIVGAADLQGAPAPQILDKRTKQEPTQPEIVVHPEEVREDDRIRIPLRAPDAPQVRIRSSDKKAWDKVKRLDD